MGTNTRNRGVRAIRGIEMVSQLRADGLGDNWSDLFLFFEVYEAGDPSLAMSFSLALL